MSKQFSDSRVAGDFVKHLDPFIVHVQYSIHGLVLIDGGSCAHNHESRYPIPAQGKTCARVFCRKRVLHGRRFALKKHVQEVLEFRSGWGWVAKRELPEFPLPLP